MSKGTFYLRLARVAPGNGLRCSLLRHAGIHVGENVKVDRHATVWKGSYLADKVQVRQNAKVIAASIGESTVIDLGAKILGVEKNPLIIGEHSYIGFNNILDGSGGLKVGNNVHIAGPSVGIWTHSTINKALMGSKITDNTYRVEGPVTIENNIWIGGLTIIYPNVKISHHSVVLPNSVVNKNVEPYTLVGGSPAKVIRKINIGESQVDLIPI